MACETSAVEPTPAHQSEDTATLVEVLNQGRSIIVVRAESPQVAAAATSVLDKAVPATPAAFARKLRMSTRDVQGIAIIDAAGRVTVGEGNTMLREIVTTFIFYREWLCDAGQGCGVVYWSAFTSITACL